MLRSLESFQHFRPAAFFNSQNIALNFAQLF